MGARGVEGGGGRQTDIRTGIERVADRQTFRERQTERDRDGQTERFR